MSKSAIWIFAAYVVFFAWLDDLFQGVSQWS
jgi:hypothetical protein